MAGVDTVIRVIASTLALVTVLFILAVGFAVMDPVYNNVIDPQLMTDLGWGTPQDTVMFFAGLAFIGLLLVIIIWWVVAPVREDVRQSQRGPF